MEDKSDFHLSGENVEESLTHLCNIFDTSNTLGTAHSFAIFKADNKKFATQSSIDSRKRSLFHDQYMSSNVYWVDQTREIATESNENASPAPRISKNSFRKSLFPTKIRLNQRVDLQAALLSEERESKFKKIKPHKKLKKLIRQSKKLKTSIESKANEAKKQQILFFPSISASSTLYLRQQRVLDRNKRMIESLAPTKILPSVEIKAKIYPSKHKKVNQMLHKLKWKKASLL